MKHCFKTMYIPLIGKPFNMEKMPENMELVIKTVAVTLFINPNHVCSDIQRNDVVEARQISIAIIKQLWPTTTLKHIGKKFFRNHTTVIYSIQQCEDRKTTCSVYREKFNCSLRRVNEALTENDIMANQQNPTTSF